MNIRSTLSAFMFALVLSSSAIAADQTFTGIVSDNMCGKQHMMKNASVAKCTRECVKAGSDYALVVGDKVYTLKGDKAQIDKFVGNKAVVTGTLNGETFTVTSIRAEDGR